MSQSTLDSRSEHIAVGGQVIGDVCFLVDTLVLDVTDEDADGVWVATDDFSTVYGDGESPEAAVHDYVECLAGQFDWLDRHRAELSGDLLNELRALEARLVRVTPR